MKNLFFIIAILFVQSSFSAELTCWLRTLKEARVPFMTATINSNSRISDIKFNYKKSMAVNGVTVKDFPGIITGEVIKNNRSPYKGLVNYFVKDAGSLVLPRDLSNTNLEEVEKSGIGFYKDENGVLITEFDEGGDGAGSHVSYRLSCRSNK